MEDGDEVCETCSKIDFISHLRLPIRNDTKIRLGRLRDIQQKSSRCSFCRLVVAQIDAELPEGLYDAAGSVQCYLRNKERWTEFEAQSGYHPEYVSRACEAERKKVLRSSRFTGHDTFCFRVVTEPNINPYNVVTARYIARLVPRSHPPIDKLYHERPLHPTHIDFNLARSWLGSCREQHGPHCEKPSWLHIQQPDFFRVVDIRNRLIIEAPRNCRFAALSYVWGEKQRLHKIYQSSKPPYRLPPDHRLSETITDAMIATLSLGLEYVWVDWLCIQQYPEINEDRREQIGQMDRIFGAATVTLVAAATKSARCGIRGVRPRESSQLQAKVRGHRFTLSQPSLMKIVDDSRWNRRAWTYQERLLSRRTVFFTADQAYFVCSCAVWCEATIAEPEPHSIKGWFVSKPLKPAHEPPQRHYTLSAASLGGSTGDLMDRPTSSFEGYQRVITEFTSRHLSWPSDGVNAVLGILKLLGRADRASMETIYHGVPVTWFDLALLWHPRCVCSRPADWKGQPQLPSWSWAGWDSQIGRGVFWDRGMFDERGKTQVLSAVKWFALYGQGSRTSIPMLEANNDEDTELQNRGPLGLDFEDRLYVEPPQLPDGFKLPRPFFYLYARTTTAVFELGEKLSWATLTLHKANVTSPYALMNHNGDCIGTIILSPAEVEEVHERRMLKFIFLSYAVAFDPRISLDASPKKPFGSYAGAVKKKSKWWLANCMWVRRAGKALERRQIARITVQAWLAAEPEIMWAILG